MFLYNICKKYQKETKNPNPPKFQPMLQIVQAKKINTLFIACIMNKVLIKPQIFLPV